MKQNGNFLKAHYDWLAVGVACAVLVAGVALYVGALGVDADELTQEKTGEIKNMTPGGAPVKPADLADFTRVTKMTKDPTSLTAVADDRASFLASEARILCTNAQCRAVVSRGVKACPGCGAVLEVVKAEDTDADQDGMPNDWERKYGFNPKDASDAALDKDGDGFANLEEFEAKTDPTDKSSHSDYLDYLAIQLPLKETVLPFKFVGVMKTPSGLKFQFKDPSRAKEYDRGNYSLLAGEEIGKSGFVPKEYVPKTEERTMGGGMKKKVDVSEAIVVRKTDGKRIPMTVDRKGVPVDVQAHLVYARDGGRQFDAVTGFSFELNGNKYVVKSVRKAAKGASVEIEEIKSGKVRTLTALEP